MTEKPLDKKTISELLKEKMQNPEEYSMDNPKINAGNMHRDRRWNTGYNCGFDDSIMFLKEWGIAKAKKILETTEAETLDEKIDLAVRYDKDFAFLWKNIPLMQEDLK